MQKGILIILLSVCSTVGLKAGWPKAEAYLDSAGNHVPPPVLAFLVGQAPRMPEAYVIEAPYDTMIWGHVQAYVERYSPRYGDFPIFPYFNGGAGNYVKDSLGLKKWSLEMLDRAVITVMQILRRYPAASDYYEVLGDLLLQYPAKREARYLATFAYLRAAYHKERFWARIQYEIKAIYALEAKGQQVKAYNDYRFARLKRRFRDALNEGVQLQQQLEAALKGMGKEEAISYFRANYMQAKRLPRQSAGELYFVGSEAKAVQELMDISPKKRNPLDGDPRKNDELLNPDISVSEVKRNVSYNFYAFGIIGMLILAVLFLGSRLKKASKNQ